MNRISEQHFSELLHQAYPKLWTIASAILRDRSLAEDAVQDAAITGLKKLDDFQAGTNFTVWMGQIVRFTSLNYLKKLKRRNANSASVHLVEEPAAKADVSQPVSSSGDLLEDQADFDDEVTHAIGLLTPEQRTCLLLRVVHNLNYEEISEIADIPKGTAMSHVHRAKAAMRTALEADDGTAGNDLAAGVDRPSRNDSAEKANE